MKKPTLSKLTKKLDSAFSLWIRNRDSGKCFTCGVVRPIKEMQCGHYVSRTHRSLRWDERNCNAQCMPCNVFRHGNMDEYALALIRKYGQNILVELAGKKQQITRLNVLDLQMLIRKYEER